MFKETETIELKKSLAQLKEGIISLSSMLNKKNEGTVYFGINDEGKVCGLVIGSKTKADITHEIQNNLKPLPNKVDIDEIIIEDKIVIKVSVEGNDTPYSAYGRYYIRLNDSDIVMSLQELKYYFEQKQDNYYSWEQMETKYGVDDINEELLIDCIRNGFEKSRIDYVYRNATHALNKLGLLTENNKLNNAGLYLFGNNKPVTIKEACFPTDSRTDFGEIKEFKGNIIECINEAVSYIQNHISYKSTITGIMRDETPEIPLKAIREIVVNSFAHCSYAKMGDYNTYTIFKSQVKIYNAGSIIKGIDPLKFAEGKVGSKIRNILISDALYNYGYIDAFGTGFDRTFSLCNKEDVKYQYYNDEFGFTFIFERKNNFLNNVISDNQREFYQYNSFERLDRIDQALINYINNNNYITIPDLAKLINKSEPTIFRHINYLVKLGRIERVGSRKKGYWKVNN